MSPWECFPVYFTIDVDKSEVGLWCEDCQLPSVVRFPVIVLSETGVGTCGFYENCMDCGEFEGEDGDDGDEDRLVRN